MDKIIGNIYKTDEYDKFSLFFENREVDDRKVKKLMKSISEHYYLSPITVDPLFRIIDGQHRFKAVKNLGLPVEYIIDNSKLEERKEIRDHVVELNKNQSSWKIEDYIRSYAISDDSYKYIMLLMYENKVNAFIALASVGKKSMTDSVKNGTLNLTKAEYENGKHIIRFANKLLDILESDKRQNEFYAIISMLRSDFVKWDTFERQCKNYKIKYTKTTSVMEALKLLIEIYNYNRPANRIRIKTVGSTSMIALD